jgi:hypothetical protein
LAGAAAEQRRTIGAIGLAGPAAEQLGTVRAVGLAGSAGSRHVFTLITSG